MGELGEKLPAEEGSEKQNTFLERKTDSRLDLKLNLKELKEQITTETISVIKKSTKQYRDDIKVGIRLGESDRKERLNLSEKLEQRKDSLEWSKSVSEVKEAAKVLTGWQINFTTWQTIFTASRHSTANKTFSPFFNNTVITGRTGATAGDLELADLLNMVFSQGEVAKFIVRKLYRWFVYYTIDDNTEQQVIAPLATIFRNNNYELKPVLTALFQSQHFYDVLNRGCVIKNPADQVIGSIRELNTSFPTATDYLSNYSMWNLMSNWMTNMGMSLNDPPNVSGMPAYYQEPLFHEIWINADSLPKRNQFTDTMIATGYLVNGIRLKFDCVALAQTFLNPGNPNDLIDEAVDRFFRNPLSVNSKAQIKTQILLTGQQWDYYWTNAWMAYTANPTTANFNTVNSRLMNLFKYLFNLAEYQLI